MSVPERYAMDSNASRNRSSLTGIFRNCHGTWWYGGGHVLILKAIPSLLTVGNLVLGVVALILSYRGWTSDAALLVVIGMVLDGLDGRVARLLHAESAFGRELDSLSDVVTF